VRQQFAPGLLTAALLACVAPGPGTADRTEQRAIVTWFADYNEVLEGTARVDPWLAQGFVDLSSPVTGARCVGPVRTTRSAPEAVPGTDCEGVEGILQLECSDERQMRANWTSGRVCGAGYGLGQDQHGNLFRMAYGMSPETARVMTSEAMAELSQRPALPHGTERGVQSGTGFFVTPQGHVVTNQHVIAGSSRVQVVIGDDEVVDAEVLAEDERNDLALLRVDAFRPSLAVRRSHGLERGEQVFTLGYPLLLLQGREQKATFGRVNALTGPRDDARFAQIDVPVQPGNSGGPLLDTRGQVVGVITAMLSQAATFDTAGVLPQSVNYALKSDVVHEMLRAALGAGQLADASEDVERPFSELIERTQDAVVIVLAW